MAISAVRPVSTSNVTFGTRKFDKDGYENPVNRKTERNLAILGAAGASTLVGATAGALTSCVTKGWKIPGAVGVAAAAATLLLTLPSKLYNTGVKAFAREKEMNVFSRQKDAQSNIYGAINNEIKDENVSLDDKINHYTTVKMADNGNGVMIKGA